jgi:exopolyphosphatase/guanosine-5'-triphosphate,3'-diphosphate pyrophosphatase
MRAVATSAVREAMNGPAFIRAAQVMCGVEIEVVDAAEEARLITLGARRALALGSRRVALFDLGGGSLEMIVSDRDTILHTRSLPLGSLRLAEVWLKDDPPDPRRLEQMRREIRKALAEPIAEMAAVGFDFVAFSSGTAKTVRSILAARGSADGSNEAMTVDSLRMLDRELGRLPAAERVKLPGLHPGRCDSIVSGTAVLRQILELTGHASATLSPGAIREGILADMLVRPTSRPGRTSEQPRPGSAAM